MTTLFAIAPVVLFTVVVGLRGVAAVRTTSDFLVASRRISPLVNSAAVSGEYLSAASFLGIAGLVVRDGIGALWYGVGFTAGFVAMLILVAAPMRRSGALTVPDFAEARLGSPALRKLAAAVVLVICGLYVVPQFRTAGLVLSAVSDSPYWVGVVIAGAAVSVTLALGGMRAATYVQAFQFFFKLLLFAVPAIWLVLQAGTQIRGDVVHPVEFEQFQRDTPVVFRVDTTLRVEAGTAIVHSDGSTAAVPVGPWHIDSGNTVVFAEGSVVPDVPGQPAPGAPGWSRPLLDLGVTGHPLLSTWAVLLATVLGTMGLPHVLIRFHTSPDGRAARRTAAFTVILLSVFYLFPGVYGALGRVLVPQLYLSEATDTTVVALPAQVETGPWAGLLTALLTAGAFAAFLATSLGLLLVISGAIAHDLLPGGLRRLRVTSLGAAAVVVLLALRSADLEVSSMVTWAFTVAASTFCPLLMLGIWWSRLTAPGALVGVATGLLASAGAFVATMFDVPADDWWGILLAQPAPWSVPLAFAMMVVVSLCGRPQSWATAAMLRLHVPQRRINPLIDHTSAARDLGHSSWSARRSSAVRRITRRLNR